MMMLTITAMAMPFSLFVLVSIGFRGTSCTDDLKNTAVAICQSDYFRAKCAWNELIVIAHAQYGRMRINYKCVSENFGYVGCSDDVTGVVDRYCSGRRACQIRVLDETFPEAQPCHEDLNSYLEVEYQCIAALTAEHQTCGPTFSPIRMYDIAPTGGPVYIAAGGSWTSMVPAAVLPPAAPLPSLSPVHVGPVVPSSASASSPGQLVTSHVSSSSCGHPSSPWLVAASPGQRILVTVVDFDLIPNNIPPGSASFANSTSSTTAVAAQVAAPTLDVARCAHRTVYAIVGEHGDLTRNNVTVCGGGSRRSTSTGTSSTLAGEATYRDGVAIDGYHRSPLSTSAEKLVRKRLVYESIGHVVEILTQSPTPNLIVGSGTPTTGAGSIGGRSTWHQPRQRRYGFVLRLDVVGCPDIEAPPGGWAFRNDETTATFGCPEPVTSPKTWQLVCLGHSWRGVMYNCSLSFNVMDDIPTEEDLKGVLVIVAVGLAFALCLSVVVARHALDPSTAPCCDICSSCSFSDNDSRTTRGGGDKESSSASDSESNDRHRRRMHRRRRESARPCTGPSTSGCNLPHGCDCDPSCTSVAVCGAGELVIGGPYYDGDVCGIAMTSGRPMNTLREV